MGEMGESGLAGEFETLAAWQDITKDFEAGNISHCRAISAPPEWHYAILERLACMTLEIPPVAPSPIIITKSTRSRSSTLLPSSGGGLESDHADLLIIGDIGKPPRVEDCRVLIEGLSLAPQNAPRRLGVVMAADKMLLPAANSLLKLAEEPPERACVLFMLEGGNLLPTLRSRAQLTVLAAPIEVAPMTPPCEIGAKAWFDWIKSARDVKAKRDAISVARDFAGWTAWALQRGDMINAVKFDRLRVIAESKNLSVPMLCDLAILTLRENLMFDF